MADVGVSLGIDAQELYQELQNVTAKFVQFSQQTTQAGEKAGQGFSGGFKGGLGGIGSNVAGALAGIGLGAEIKSVVEYGAHIQDLSDRFGVGVVTLQKFGNAAEKNGASLESVAKGFRFLEVNQAKALSGNDAMVTSFANLGISVEQLKSLSPEEIMLKLGNSSLNAADTVKVLGKSALELRPTLAGLADGTIQFGHAMDALDIARLKEAEDAFKNLKETTTIFTGTLLGGFVSAWQQGINSIISLLQALGTSVAANVAGIGKILHGDLSGGAHDIAEGVRGAVERVRGGAETNKDLAGGGAEERKRRDFGAVSGESEAGETDDQGRSLGGGGGTGGKKAKAEFDSTQDRVDKKAEEQRLADLSPADRLADLRGKADALRAESQASYPELGSGEAQRKLELEEDYYDVAKKITEEEKKQSTEKERDDQREKHNLAALDSAKETTKQMQLRIEGDKVGAEQAGIRAKYEKEIAAALDRKNPNEPLADELRKQEGIALHESNVKEAGKSPAEKLAEEKRLREEGQKRNLAEALARDQEDRANRQLHGAGGLTTGHVQGSGGLNSGSLSDALSDSDFHAQFQQKGLGLGSDDDFHKQFQQHGITRADQVKQGAIGKDSDNKPADKLDTASDKLGKVADKLDAALHI